MVQATTLADGAAGIIVTARDVTTRLAAEQALKDSEILYRLLADQSSDMVSRLDLGGFRRYVSPASREILGRPAETLVGTHPTAFIHPDEAARVAGFLDRMGTGALDDARSIHRASHADGSWIWVETIFRLVRDGSGAPAEIVSNLRDVSVRKGLQDQVQAGADLLRATLEAMDQGLLVVSPERRVTVFNHRAADLVGLDATPSPAGGNGEPDLHDTHFDWLFLEGGLAASANYQHHRDDGSWLDVRRIPLPDGGALLTLRDVSERKHAHMREREANRLLTMAEEIAHVGHWRFGLADETVTWSDEVFRIHGLAVGAAAPTVAEAIALYHPDDRATVAACIAKAIGERGNFEFELRIRRPDGEVRRVLARGLCEIDAGTDAVSGLFGVFMDVTDLARAKRDLDETTEHLKATLDNIDQGLVKIAADGTVELANRRFGELLDLPTALTTRPALNFEDVLEHLAARGEFTAAGADVQDDVRQVYEPLTLGTYERQRPDGTILEVRTVPLPGGAVLQTYADITARRRAETAMRDSEAQYRMLADSTSDVITRLDLDLRRRYVSPACRGMLGYEPEELIGEQAAATAHPDDVGTVVSVAKRLIAGGFPNDHATLTNRIRHKLGHWIWVEAGLNLVRDGISGAPDSIICTIRDVSERQRAARHLEAAKTAAEAAARIKSEFLANMSHELRTPLTGILGIHDLLDADPDLGIAQKRYVGMARDAGRSLLAIVNDVLDLSKIEAGQVSIVAAPFDLATLVESCRALAQEGARTKPLRVEASVGGGTVTLQGDEARLRQVLLNLMMNAVKFTEQGSVALHAAYDHHGATLRVDVTDTGIGIASDQLPSLFERFTQADASVSRRYGGTGLGLAICKRLVELMGGTIMATSDLGRGSTFSIAVPLRALAWDEAQAAAVPAASSPGFLRILLAEDNAINSDIIRAMLQHSGHEVVAVDNGAAAAAAVRADGTFSVVLMDMQMPIMDGLRATVVIRAAEAAQGRRPTPIIGLTANAMADDVERCRSAGMNAHVAKPIDWPRLFATIEEVTVKAPAAAVGGLTDDIDREVIDDATLETLAGFIGRKRLAAMLGDFVTEVGTRLQGLDAEPADEVARRAHSFVSLAGQLGFLELSRVCADVEAETRSGARPIRVERVLEAARRAVEAARRSRHRDAAASHDVSERITGR